jgi:hypothetical protein
MNDIERGREVWEGLKNNAGLFPWIPQEIMPSFKAYVSHLERIEEAAREVLVYINDCELREQYCIPPVRAEELRQALGGGVNGLGTPRP